MGLPLPRSLRVCFFIFCQCKHRVQARCRRAAVPRCCSSRCSASLGEHMHGVARDVQPQAMRLAHPGPGTARSVQNASAVRAEGRESSYPVVLGLMASGKGWQWGFEQPGAVELLAGPSSRRGEHSSGSSPGRLCALTLLLETAPRRIFARPPGDGGTEGLPSKAFRNLIFGYYERKEYDAWPRSPGAARTRRCRRARGSCGEEAFHSA